jgi:hypothetical protein
MINNYESNSVYHVFETGDTSKKFKIGEIENDLFFDVDRNGKRIGNGVRFYNNSTFWSQFTRVQIKKISKPLGGYEPLVWGVYWTLSAIISIILIVATNGTNNQIFWLIVSGIHFWLSIKFRNNKLMVYWMAAASIIAIFIFLAGNKKK